MANSIEVRRISEGRFSLDVRGQVCPYPELLTLKALQSLSKGDVLEVILDNPPSLRDISITLKKREYRIPEVVRSDGGTWTIIIHNSK